MKKWNESLVSIEEKIINIIFIVNVVFIMKIITYFNIQGGISIIGNLKSLLQF